MHTSTIDPAVAAYETLAPHYETFTRAYRHDAWMRALADLAREHGLPDGPVLDVACGTGKSLRPLLAMGFDAAGCDLSPEMLAEARRALPGVELHEADMRALPGVGRFAWLTCMNDAVNCLLEDDGLDRALASMAAALVPGGLLTFDLNTASAHRRAFTRSWTVEEPGTFLCWQGLGCDDDGNGAGAIGRSEIVIFTEGEDGWSRSVSRHVERLWTAGEVGRAASAAGLEPVAVYGQRRGCVLEPFVDEREHSKCVYFLRRSPARRFDSQEGGDLMIHDLVLEP